jgi:tRNA(adenine34) deaminase
MQKAINIAKSSFIKDEVPIGAVLVDSANDRVITTSGNLMNQMQDPTMHAEMNVIKQGFKLTGQSRLNECDLYVTLEPCPMCASAISLARIRRLYFGAYDPKGGGVEHGAKIFNASSCFHKPEIYGGISEEECSSLLKDFFSSKRL